MNRIGKGGRRNAAANKITHARFVKEGIDCCQLCGRTGDLSNSHSENADRRNNPTKTALLCIFRCHQFLELKCNHEERKAVNDFVITTTLEGEDRFNEAMKLLPPDKAAKFRETVLRS